MMSLLGLAGLHQVLGLWVYPLAGWTLPACPALLWTLPVFIFSFNKKLIKEKMKK